ncbi:MAG: GGDEF domain-containing protein [Rhodoferax sp.]|nr:GGDEF domain-containing protein [Rhodoferax sp.]
MQLLHQTALAMQHGDVAHSLTLSKSALAQAQQQQDLHMEARALLCLAQADNMVARFRRAQETAQRAATLFQMCDDPQGEAEALSALAQTVSVMGHADDGTEAALMALKLQSGSPAAAQAHTYNSLGVTYSHAGSFDRAAAAFDRAIALLEAQGQWMGAYQPRANQRAMEVTRCFFDRYYHGEFRDLQRLGRLRQQQGRIAQVPPNLLVLQGAHVKTQALMGLCDGFEACWLGQLDIAQSHADFAKMADTRGEANPSVTLAELWLRTEIAWAGQDWSLAEYQCHRMMQLAMSLDHEHMVGIAYLLLAQVFSAQGKDTASQAQLRALKLRENGLRQAAQQQREERIEWQLQARASHATRRRLEAQAQELEQLAMEDALTGLYNRRYLERMAPALLRKGAERGHAPAMAFIDVDFFKHINDNFSHQVGDEVLKALAQILRSFVREGDVPVRLGGDEFVVAFSHVESAGLHGLSQRIQQAVQAYAWDRLGPGLVVSVSVGVATAEPEDDLAAWLHRCDQGMYDAKDSKHQSLA